MVGRERAIGIRTPHDCVCGKAAAALSRRPDGVEGRRGDT